MLSASGNLFKCHEEVLYLQPLIPPKLFDIFSPITGGCSEGLGVFWFFFKYLGSKKLNLLLEMGVEKKFKILVRVMATILMLLRVVVKIRAVLVNMNFQC